MVTHCPSCFSNSGYVCMAFYRREGHVIELQQSSKYKLECPLYSLFKYISGVGEVCVSVINSPIIFN